MKKVKWLCTLSLLVNMFIPLTSVYALDSVTNQDNEIVESVRKEANNVVTLNIGKTLNPYLKKEADKILIETDDLTENILLSKLREVFKESLSTDEVYLLDERKNEYELFSLIEKENGINVFELALKEAVTEETKESLESEIEPTEDDNALSESEETHSSGVALLSPAPAPNSLAAIRAIPPLPNDPNIKPLNNIFGDVVGTGPKVINGGKALQITSTTGQVGAIWSKKKLDLKKPFKLKSYIYLGAQGPNAADGITFTLHSDDRAHKAIGNSGSGLGAYSGRDSQQHIKNALSFEFDTHYNNEDTKRLKDKMDKELLPPKLKNRKSLNHVAFAHPSASNHNSNDKQHIEPRFLNESTFLSDGEWKEFNVTWDNDTKELSVSLPDLQLYKVENDNMVATENTITYKLNNYTSIFGGDEVYWGFTGATGALWADNAIAMTSIPNSVTNELKVKKSDDEVYRDEVKVKSNDVVMFKNTLKLDDRYSEFMPEDQVLLPLNSLTYKEGTLKIFGEPVNEKDINKENNQLKIELGKIGFGLDNRKNLELTYEAQIKESRPGTFQNYQTNYSSDGVISDSNQVKLTFIKPAFKLTSTVKKDGEEEYRDNLEMFEGTPVVIRNQVTRDNLDTVYEKDDVLEMSLKGLDITSLFISINNEELKPSFYDVSENNVLKINLEDDNLVAKLNQLEREKPVEFLIKTRLGTNLKTTPLNYQFTYISRDFKDNSNKIEITIKEEVLKIVEVPTKFDFGEHYVDSKSHQYWSNVEGNLRIHSNRPKNAKQWKLTVRESKPLVHTTNAEKTLSGSMWWFDKNSKQYITDKEVIVREQKQEDENEVEIITEWKKDERGIGIDIGWEQQAPGEYSGTLQWNLTIAP